MAHSLIRVYLHYVWHTAGRESLLRGRLETFVDRQIRATLQEEELLTLAVNSAWDHVHVFAGWNGSTALGDFAQKAKGRTSYLWNNKAKRDGEPDLSWQRGYGVLSVRRSDVSTVINYVDGQKRHHARNEVWRPFEEITEES
jgi:putative transposase